MSEGEIRDAVEIARKHDLLIISDEIYEPFLYDVDRAAGGLYSAATIYDRTLILRGFSKSHAMTGWRLGYAAGPEEVIGAMTKLQQYTFVWPRHLSRSPRSKHSMWTCNPRRDSYRRKRDLVYQLLSKKFEVVKPGGAFYIFPKAPAGITAADFCTKAIEKNVLIIPGNIFSGRDTHFRISYATTDEKIMQGCEILNSLA